MLCTLCKNKNADQTGSHITSAFLIASQIGKRGNEKSFLITTNPEDDYKQNHGDTLVKEDYIFCRDCEKRLGIIEAIYSREITQKIELPRFRENFTIVGLDNGFYKLICKKVHPIAFQLFILSLVWRASISEQPLFQHFKVSESIEERIRFNLDLFLPSIIDYNLALTEKEWLNLIEKCKDLFDVIPFVVFKADSIPNNEITYDFFDNITKQPYHISINDYYILLFNDNLDWTDDFFDFRNEVELNQIINNNTNDSTICIIPNERFIQTNDKIKNMAAHEFKRNKFINDFLSSLTDFSDNSG